MLYMYINHVDDHLFFHVNHFFQIVNLNSKDLKNRSIEEFNKPVYSGKQIFIGEKRNCSANKSFLFK